MLLVPPRVDVWAPATSNLFRHSWNTSNRTDGICTWSIVFDTPWRWTGIKAEGATVLDTTQSTLPKPQQTALLSPLKHIAAKGMALNYLLPLIALLGLAIPARAAIVPGGPNWVELFNPNSSPIGNTNVSGLCWTAASNTDGAAVTAQPCQGVGTDSQSWVFSPGTTTIKVFGNKCLDVTNGVDASGTKLQIYGCSTANKNQQWSVTTSSSGIETIQWANSTRCVDLTGGTAGSALQIWTCQSSNNNQKWLAFDATFGPPHTAHSLHILPQQSDTDRQLAAIAGGASNNQPVYLEFSDIDDLGMNWNYDGTKLSQADIGNLCLDVTDGVDADGTKLQVYACTAGNTNQEWVVTGNGNDFSKSTIQWKNHNKCVDLTDGKLSEGTPLQLWTCSSGNTNQQWNFVPTN